MRRFPAGTGGGACAPGGARANSAYEAGALWLLATQGQDGSWRSVRDERGIRTTALAVLALSASGKGSLTEYRDAVGYFRAMQRPDGSWGTQASGQETATVTDL